MPQPNVETPKRAFDNSRVDTVEEPKGSTHVMGGPLGWAGLGLRACIDLSLFLGSDWQWPAARSRYFRRRWRVIVESFVSIN